jgi:hypothetical protein
MIQCPDKLQGGLHYMGGSDATKSLQGNSAIGESLTRHPYLQQVM